MYMNCLIKTTVRCSLTPTFLAGMMALSSSVYADSQPSGDASGVNNGKSGMVLTLATASGTSMLDFGALNSGASSSAQSVRVCNTGNQPVEMLPKISGVQAQYFQFGNTASAVTLGASGASDACVSLSVIATAPGNLADQVSAGEKKAFYFSGLVGAGINTPYSTTGQASLRVLPLQFSVTVDKTDEGDPNA